MQKKESLKKYSQYIFIKGARTHNLKNVSLSIPKNKLVVITGISGSGKSSLAFDTLYAEGQRRYIESLSAYARQFLGMMTKPDVDYIEGLSPAISIDQKSVSSNPRSTVGTITEIYDYLRLLFARVGDPYCPECKILISKQSASFIVDKLINFKKGSYIEIFAPIIRSKKGEHSGVLSYISNSGYLRVRIDGDLYKVSEISSLALDKNKKHNIDILVDRIVIDSDLERLRVHESVEAALKLSDGILYVSVYEGKKKKDELIFSENFLCPKCGYSLPEIEPRIFSFNSPHGACSKCTGIGKKLEVDPDLVIPNKKLTLREGAIKPWASFSRGNLNWMAIEDLSHHFNFSLDVPVYKLSASILNLILYGDGKFGFEGVIPNLERKWRETESDWIRSEIEKYMRVKKCPECKGSRLKKESLNVFIDGKNIAELSSFSVDKLKSFFLKIKLSGEKKKIADVIIKEIKSRLSFLVDVGLEYLSLSRDSDTLSGGEVQRIRLATQIGSKLTGVLYILDEPSIGLHPKDNKRLIDTLKQLKEMNNSVLVVEHDEETMLSADWIIEIGKGAGKHGGNIVFEGTPEKLKRSKTATGIYLSNKKKAFDEALKIKKNNKPKDFIILKGARENNLKNIDVQIPIGQFVCITGVSGSGKSTLVDEVLVKALKQKIYNSNVKAGEHDVILGWEKINKVIYIDQSPIGKTPRSNPATYTGVFTHIRNLFAETNEAKIRGYKPGRFSFNVKGGRCEACEGQGVKKIEMHFLPDVYVECEECKGKRYNKEVLEIEFKGKNISDVLEMTVDEAYEFFKTFPKIKEILSVLKEVGVGYLQLGQNSTTLSGGEAQRIKLADELSRKDTGDTLYVLDEPTTGLHFADVEKLLLVLQRLVNKGNTVLVIEHNLDVVATSDWVVDLGKDGGEKGGRVIFQGKKDDLLKCKASYTAKFLKDYLNK